jgi:hypothetical protein
VANLNGLTNEEVSLLESLPDFGKDLAASVDKPDWTYYDLPKMGPKYFDQLIYDIIGEDNVSFLTRVSHTDRDGDWFRGQILISPAGMDNIREYRRVHIL